VGYFAREWNLDREEPQLKHFDTGILQQHQRFWRHDQRSQAIAMDLSRRLQLFTGTSPLAGFVDGPNTLSLSNTLTVIELSKLSEHKALQGIILFATLHLLKQFFRDPTQLSIPKYFIGDENWAMLQNEATAEVIEEIVRTFRKLFVSAWFLSQQGSDFDTQVGQVILKNTNIKLCFAQDPREITAMKTLFQLNDAEVTLLRKARNRGRWSSALLKLPDDQGGLVRLVSDTGTNWIAGQLPRHKAARAEALQRTGKPLLETFAATHGLAMEEEETEATY
jgi:hypothetical protein